MKIGVVGKPNVGKSTFFKALTLAPVDIANYPFVTIKPNRGFGNVRVECPEKDFGVKCQPKQGFCIEGNRFVPVELIDVAGLVPGAHQGKGLGNEFLNDLREADALIHIIDVAGATNEKGEPVAIGSNNPAEDILFLERELDMWVFSILKRGWERFFQKIQHEHLELDRALLEQLSGLKVRLEAIRETLKELGVSPRSMPTDEQLMKISTSIRHKSKPMIIAANKLDLPGGKENLKRLKGEFPNQIIVGCSAEAELALREAAQKHLVRYIPGASEFQILSPESLSEKQRGGLEFIKAAILSRFHTTGVQDVLNKAVFQLLGYIAVFPVANSHLKDKDGNVLPDCFLVPGGTTALEFAYKVHTDIGNKFVKAINLKTHKAVGKELPLQDGDVIEIMTAQ